MNIILEKAHAGVQEKPSAIENLCSLFSRKEFCVNRDQRRLDSFTLTDIFDTAIVNDEHVLHGVTPIVQLDTDKQAYRDVLVVTFKKKIN